MGRTLKAALTFFTDVHTRVWRQQQKNKYWTQVADVLSGGDKDGVFQRNEWGGFTVRPQRGLPELKLWNEIVLFTSGDRVHSSAS